MRIRFLKKRLQTAHKFQSYLESVIFEGLKKVGKIKIFWAAIRNYLGKTQILRAVTRIYWGKINFFGHG